MLFALRAPQPLIKATFACLVLMLLSQPRETMAQTPLKPSGPGWLEHWRLSTFSFGRIQKQNQRDFFEVIGTGVLVAINPQTAYIVTAKHVFDDPTKNWHPSEVRLRFAWEERQSVYEGLGIAVKLLQPTGEPIWHAPNSGADIAAIPITIAQLQASGQQQPHAISTQDLATSDDLYEGASLLVLGYPGIVGNEYLVRAISRGGIIAWTNPESPYKKPFLIDANIYPGNSGGPVISLPTGADKYGNFGIGAKPKLLGIVSKAPGQNTDILLQVPGAVQPL